MMQPRHGIEITARIISKEERCLWLLSYSIKLKSASGGFGRSMPGCARE